MARYTDSHQNLSTAIAKTEFEQLTSACQLAESVYNVGIIGIKTIFPEIKKDGNHQIQNWLIHN